MVKVASYNVAGLRAILKKPQFNEFIYNTEIDILCIQETKADVHQIILDEEICNKFPYRYYNSTKGTTQRRGLSGTAIWCKTEPLKQLVTPEFDEEGRIIALEFAEHVIVCVYVPNSQKLESARYRFRQTWNDYFIEYIKSLEALCKPVIICGDMNVALHDIDISNPGQKKNRVAGFFDSEREKFRKLLDTCNICDVYRYFNPTGRASTYWSNFLKAKRDKTNGWRIDYILITHQLINSINRIEILDIVEGSDHCPIIVEF